MTAPPPPRHSPFIFTSFCLPKGFQAANIPSISYRVNPPVFSFPLKPAYPQPMSQNPLVLHSLQSTFYAANAFCNWFYYSSSPLQSKRWVGRVSLVSQSMGRVQGWGSLSKACLASRGRRRIRFLSSKLLSCSLLL